MSKLRRGFVKRKDGTLQYTFMYEGKRYYTYGKTYSECENKADTKREKLKQKLYIKNGKITLNQYYEEWEESRKGVIKASTMYSNRTRWNSMNKYIGSKRITDIEKREVVMLQKQLLEDGYSTSGVNARLSQLKSIFHAAMIERIIPFNPCEGVKALKRTEKEARDTNHRALTLEEQNLFMKYATNSWYYELWALMLTTGCRVGEAAALTWNDIDYEKNVIHITKTITKTVDGGLSIGTPKTKTSLRDIPLTEASKTILTMQREKMKLINGNIVDVSGIIFKTTKGNKIGGYNIEYSIDAILKKIEIETGTHIDHFSSHAFRDTFATRAIESGMQPQTLKTILGHTSLAMTMDLYAHVMPNTKEEEMKLISFAI